MRVTHQKAFKPMTLIQASASKNFLQSITVVNKPTGANDPVAEINAFIAIREELLAEAEEVPTFAKLDSVSVANDFIETCLQQTQPAYKSQQLDPADGARERQRCCEVKARIVELRARAGTGTRAPR